MESVIVAFEWRRHSTLERRQFIIKSQRKANNHPHSHTDDRQFRVAKRQCQKVDPSSFAAYSRGFKARLRKFSTAGSRWYCKSCAVGIHDLCLHGNVPIWSKLLSWDRRKVRRCLSSVRAERKPDVYGRCVGFDYDNRCQNGCTHPCEYKTVWPRWEPSPGRHLSPLIREVRSPLPGLDLTDRWAERSTICHCWGDTPYDWGAPWRADSLSDFEAITKLCAMRREKKQHERVDPLGSWPFFLILASPCCLKMLLRFQHCQVHSTLSTSSETKDLCWSIGRRPWKSIALCSWIVAFLKVLENVGRWSCHV